MKIRGTDFVLYHVSDLSRAVKFYRDVLGLKQEILSEEYQWAEFNCGNLTLALKGGAKAGEIPAGARLALAVGDITAAHAELQAKGVSMAAPPQSHGNCQHLEVSDPDGHVVILHRRDDGTCGQQPGRTRTPRAKS
ncbi:MAG: VOC family protein [Lacunisphaera sp.]|nr:VOC family protein [Lacunisphaera sp.]